MPRYAQPNNRVPRHITLDRAVDEWLLREAQLYNPRGTGYVVDQLVAEEIKRRQEAKHGTR